MFCKNCGAQLPDGASFCAQCGAETRAAAPAQTIPAPAPAPIQTPAPTMPAAAWGGPMPQTPLAPTTAGTGFRVVNCILAPFALMFAILNFVFSIKNAFDYFEYSSRVLSGITAVVGLVLMLVSAIWLLAVATKREYRRGSAVVPLVLYIASELMHMLINIIQSQGEALRYYYFTTDNGLKQTIPLFLVFVSMIFYFVLVKSARSPRPALWPLWIVLVGLVAEVVSECLYFSEIAEYMDYFMEDSPNLLFSFLFYVLFFLICIFMVIRTALLAKRGVPIAGRPRGGQPYAAPYASAPYQPPYMR